MKIALVSSKTSLFGGVPDVAASLHSKVHGLNVEEKTVETNLDIVATVARLKGFDAIAVIVFYAEDTPDLRVLMDKLVDLDLKGIHTIKFFVKGEDFDEEEETSRITGTIMERLFGASVDSKPAGKRSFSEL